MVDDNFNTAAFLSTLPAPTETSKWDGIFLVPIDQQDFGILLAWFWQTFICTTGELHQEWLMYNRPPS